MIKRNGLKATAQILPSLEVLGSSGLRLLADATHVPLHDCVMYRYEHEDAKETKEWVEKAGRRAILIDGNLAEEATCK